jgi:hypothetical protein
VEAVRGPHQVAEYLNKIYLQSRHHRTAPFFFLAATKLALQGNIAGLMTSLANHLSSCRLSSGSSALFMGRYLHLMGYGDVVTMSCLSRSVTP